MTARYGAKRTARSKHAAWGVFAAACIALAMSACSSSSSAANSSGTSAASSGVAAAKAAVAVLTKPAAPITLPGGAVNAAALKGKTIAYIPIVYTDPYFHSVEAGLADAFKSVGAKVVPCDAQGSPSDTTQCLDNALNIGAAAVVIDTIPPAFAPSAFNALSAKGVPIIFIGSPSGTKPQNKDQAQVFASESSSPAGEGRDAANAIIADSNGSAKVLLVQLALAPSFNEDLNGTKSILEKDCPKCEVNTISVTSTIGRLRLRPSAPAFSSTQVPITW